MHRLPFVYWNWVPSLWFSGSGGTWNYTFVHTKTTLVYTTCHINLHRLTQKWDVLPLPRVTGSHSLSTAIRTNFPVVTVAFFPITATAENVGDCAQLFLKAQWLNGLPSRGWARFLFPRELCSLVYRLRWVEGVLPRKRLRKHHQIQVRNGWGSLGTWALYFLSAWSNRWPTVRNKGWKVEEITTLLPLLFCFPSGENIVKVWHLLSC